MNERDDQRWIENCRSMLNYMVREGRLLEGKRGEVNRLCDLALLGVERNPQGPTLSGIQDASDTVASAGSALPKLAEHDLVSRLRSDFASSDADLPLEAADRIERLELELAEQHRDRNSAHRCYLSWMGRADDLVRELAKAYAALADAVTWIINAEADCTYDSEADANQGSYGLSPHTLIGMKTWRATHMDAIDRALKNVAPQVPGGVSAGGVGSEDPGSSLPSSKVSDCGNRSPAVASPAAATPNEKR